LRKRHALSRDLHRIPLVIVNDSQPSVMSDYASDVEQAHFHINLFHAKRHRKRDESSGSFTQRFAEDAAAAIRIRNTKNTMRRLNFAQPARVER